jgi:hypothetical protein
MVARPRSIRPARDRRKAGSLPAPCRKPFERTTTPADVAIRQDSPQHAKIANYGEKPLRHRKKKRQIRAQKKLDWTVERNPICFRAFMRPVWVDEATSAVRPGPLSRPHLTTILHYFQSRITKGCSPPVSHGIRPARAHQRYGATAAPPEWRHDAGKSGKGVDGPVDGDGRTAQSFRCRNAATPAMNICTDSAISSMPITRSSAVSTLSPSQRNR